jgi:hypothetical protein
MWTMINNCRSLAECPRCHVLFVPGRSWTGNCCSKECAAVFTSLEQALIRRELRFGANLHANLADFH